MEDVNTQTLPFTQRIDGALSQHIGQRGLDPARVLLWLERLTAALADLQADLEKGSLPLLTIPSATADIAEARQALQRLSQGAETLILFGMGGSSLGGQVLAHFTAPYLPSSPQAAGSSRPQLRFYENLDPHTLSGLLANLDLATTRFLVISKSGGTPETLMQAMAAMDAVRQAGLGERMGEHFLAVTDPETPGKTNGLRALCAHYGIPVLDHHPGIGGRYSVLTNVGLLPAMAVGLDVQALRAGAQAVLDSLAAAKSPAEFPPAVGAALSVGLAREKGIRTVVLMPYVDRLARLSHWFVQLWAESLGKHGQGTTPLAALGPVDQHSQLQLFLDGPPDHMLTLIRTQCAGMGPVVPEDLARLAGANYLAGHSAGDLVTAEQDAIYETLIRNGRPVRVLDIPELDTRALGALLMHFMLETILAASLFGVDPFDQPAVELGKTLTREALTAMSTEAGAS